MTTFKIGDTVRCKYIKVKNNTLHGPGVIVDVGTGLLSGKCLVKFPPIHGSSRSQYWLENDALKILDPNSSAQEETNEAVCPDCGGLMSAHVDEEEDTDELCDRIAALQGKLLDLISTEEDGRVAMIALQEAIAVYLHGACEVNGYDLEEGFQEVGAGIHGSLNLLKEGKYWATETDANVTLAIAESVSATKQ